MKETSLSKRYSYAMQQREKKMKKLMKKRRAHKRYCYSLRKREREGEDRRRMRKKQIKERTKE